MPAANMATTVQRVAAETKARLVMALTASGAILAASTSPTDEETTTARIVAKAAAARPERAGLWEPSGAAECVFAAVTDRFRVVVFFEDAASVKRVIGCVLNALDPTGNWPGRTLPGGGGGGGGGWGGPEPAREELPLPRKRRSA